MTRSTAAEHRRAVAGGERVDDLVEQRRVGVAEQRQRAVVGDALAARPGRELVEDRLRVTRRSGAGADDERQHERVDVDALARAHSSARCSRMTCGGISRNR